MNASDFIKWSSTNPVLLAVLSIDVEDTPLVKKLHAPYEIRDFSVSSTRPEFMGTITGHL